MEDEEHEADSHLMAAGRIQNREALQAVADFFDVEGVKRAPAFLNLEQVLLTYDLSQLGATAAPGGGSGTLAPLTNSMTNIVGEPTYRYRIITVPNAAAPVFLDNGFAYRIDTLEVELVLDAAGSTAMNGKNVNLDLYFQEQGGDPPPKYSIVSIVPGFLILTNVLRYKWTLRGSSHVTLSNWLVSTWNGRVDKSDMDLTVELETHDLSNFPANTVFRVTMIARRSSNDAVPEN